MLDSFITLRKASKTKNIPILFTILAMYFSVYNSLDHCLSCLEVRGERERSSVSPTATAQLSSWEQPGSDEPGLHQGKARKQGTVA